MNLWETIPLDIIKLIFLFLDKTKDIENLCSDSYIFDKLCKNSNGEL